jgi:CheY-like chemotaxis protein
MHKILLVEDEEANRDMLTRRLEFRGFSVVCATNGLEAIAAAETEKPDLILMDLKMPELDGYEATRRLKQSAATSAIPVIALTAYAMKGDREKALAAGCDECDEKPIEMPRLMAKVYGFLQKQQEG